MRVFITGATGFIGEAVSVALARAGHEVAGLVRAAEKGRRLAAREVTPVVGSMQEPASYFSAAAGAEVLIHCAVEYSASSWQLDRLSIETLLAAARDSGLPRLIVYTSGVWVYGDTGGRLVDEASPLDPPAFVAPRASHEQLVLAAGSRTVRCVVARPGCVYGGRGGLTGAWFSAAAAGRAVPVIGDGSARWAMVHVEDLADAYLRIAESSLAGEVLNVTDRSRFTVRECAVAAHRVAGGDGAIAEVPLEAALAEHGPMAAALAFDQHVDSRKAVRLLGWQPRHAGFTDGASRYFTAWRAAQPANAVAQI